MKAGKEPTVGDGKAGLPPEAMPQSVIDAVGHAVEADNTNTETAGPSAAPAQRLNDYLGSEHPCLL